MNNNNVLQEKQRAIRVRRKPEYESVLHPMFAATRHDTSSPLWSGQQQESNILQRQLDCGTQENCGSSLLRRTTAEEMSDDGVAENHTGMPDNLKAGLEHLSGFDLSAVRVHSDSPKPAQISALAYAQGQDIHLAPGQEQHLPHEGWHVVQQMHGRVKATWQAKGVSINDDSYLEREADVMGAQALQASRSLTSLHQGIEGTSLLPEEEPDLVQVIGSMNSPVIQRSTAWKAGAVHETINLATMILFGGSPITWHLLNGSKLTTDAVAEGAIKSPSISTSGSGTDWKATVSSVDANEGSFDETVLQAGPWTRAAPKATVAARIGLAACTGVANSNFRAIGKPSDNDVFNANRRHEDHHASDHNDAFNDTIGKWDKKLDKAKTDKTEFKGTSAADATSKLWTAMGGKAKAVAKAYRALGFAKGGAYHGTPAGGTMSLANPKANANCTTSSVEVTNPS